MGIGMAAPPVDAGLMGLGGGVQRGDSGPGVKGSTTGEAGGGALGGIKGSTTADFSIGPVIGLSEIALAAMDGMPPSLLMESIKNSALGLVTYNANAAVVPAGSQLQGDLLGTA